ncbi:hypothetical protein ALQ62_02583 [Pseudomonas coronafaciens pv. zizaniae]|uniref:hypothetical protein n=1 Tax=Pseudomonas coronafaciens TaxID=53409 RepID=UPI000F40F345|nr:hypothetical protein [Pseudomonas coronafaciens]RMN27791.1 hypothetical protein ALQ62_02583 [Pseudomonas coronafaciens pv. zizaniae]
MTAPSVPTLPVPFIQGASAKNEVRLGKNITLVLPAFTEPAGKRVMLNLTTSKTDFSRQIIKGAPIKKGKATVVTVANLNEGKIVFKPSDEVVVSGSVEVTGGTWIDIPVSIPYTFID